MIPLYATYAFQDVTAILKSPYGTFTISGPETAAAEEAITITWGEESNTQTIGADGSVMNSMHSARAGTVVFRLLKTSPMNEKLQQVFHYEHQSSALWGNDTITIENPARGDKYVLLGCAWVRIPTNTYAKVGNTLEYEMHVAIIDSRLGSGANLNYGGTGNVTLMEEHETDAGRNDFGGGGDTFGARAGSVFARAMARTGLVRGF